MSQWIGVRCPRSIDGAFHLLRLDSHFDDPTWPGFGDGDKGSEGKSPRHVLVLGRRILTFFFFTFTFTFTFTSFTIHQFIITSLRRPKLRTASSRPDGSSNQDRTTSRVSLRAAPLPGIRMYVRKENQHFLWCGRQAGDTTVISTRTAACVECVSTCENGAATAGVSE